MHRELRSAAGVRYRVHVRDRRGHRFAAAAYPLLALRSAPPGSLFFNGGSGDPAAVAATLDATVRAVTDGWRSLADYADLDRDVETAPRAAHGVLMTGPEPACSALAAALAAALA